MSSEPRSNTAATATSLMSNWLSLIGAILAASSFFAAASLITIDFFRNFRNPYMGILTYIVAPGFLVAGLALMLSGVILERRRRRFLQCGEVPRYPSIDLNVPRQRHAFIIVIAGSFAFLLLTALGSYRTYQLTESVEFCGETCHTVMQPEYVAYQQSPHARVACAECHIGSGASWFVKSKLSGAYQVYSTLFNKYSRPIPVPIAHLRPAQDTCEQCHWPRQFYGAVERTNNHYLADEGNSPWMIRMLLKIGGGDPSFGPVGGIHWHMNISARVDYIHTDKDRQTIPWVRITTSQGTRVYQSKGEPLKPEQIAAGEQRTMDCIDCHNRPTHIYRAPVQAVNVAISTGRIDARIPYIKKQALAALTADYATTEKAMQGINDTLRGFYQSNYPDLMKEHATWVDRSIIEIKKIYSENFFPAMRVNWRVYADNIGHVNFPGCFRCHDGNHVSADGKVLTRDCNMCHTIIAQGQGNKAATIAPAGLEFQHPVDIGDAWRTTLCSDCHTGALTQ